MQRPGLLQRPRGKVSGKAFSLHGKYGPWPLPITLHQHEAQSTINYPKHPLRMCLWRSDKDTFVDWLLSDCLCWLSLLVFCCVTYMRYWLTFLANSLKSPPNSSRAHYRQSKQKHVSNAQQNRFLLYTPVSEDRSGWRLHSTSSMRVPTRFRPVVILCSQVCYVWAPGMIMARQVWCVWIIRKRDRKEEVTLKRTMIQRQLLLLLGRTVPRSQ